MTTRWDKIREDLNKLVNQDKISPTTIPVLEKLQNMEFNCGMCKNKLGRGYTCGDNINDCRQNYAEWLNQEVEEGEIW